MARTATSVKVRPNGKHPARALPAANMSPSQQEATAAATPKPQQATAAKRRWQLLLEEQKSFEAYCRGCDLDGLVSTLQDLRQMIEVASRQITEKRRTSPAEERCAVCNKSRAVLDKTGGRWRKVETVTEKSTGLQVTKRYCSDACVYNAPAAAALRKSHLAPRQPLASGGEVHHENKPKFVPEMQRKRQEAASSE